jgi:hypothetical protein
MVEVMDAITPVAVANSRSRSVMPWRAAIHLKSVYTAQTWPASSWLTSRRTGQSSAASGLAGERRLVDLGEVHDALRRDVGLDARDRLRHRIGAPDAHDAVALGERRRREQQGEGKRCNASNKHFDLLYEGG